MSDAQLLALEIFFVGLIVSVVIFMGWISWIVLSRLYKGQR